MLLKERFLNLFHLIFSIGKHQVKLRFLPYPEGTGVSLEFIMKDLIKYIAQALVDNPDAVVVQEVEGNQTSVLELKVAKEDLGKVIGKQGRTARAMRTILSAASAKVKKRTVLEILE